MAAPHLVVVGGSDAGIAAAMRARELDPSWDVTVLVADAYPNFSICGIPYYLSGEVGRWQNLAHRSEKDLEATGMSLRLETAATGIDAAAHLVTVRGADGISGQLPYDGLILATGAESFRPPIDGLSGPDALGPADGVHVLHSMSDARAVAASLQTRQPRSALVVGAGYIGLEMAEALTLQGITVTQVEALPEVLPTVDPPLGALVRAELQDHGVQVLTSTAVRSISRTAPGALLVHGTGPQGPVSWTVDLVLVVVGVRPQTDLATAAGVRLGVKGAIDVDEQMRTNLPDIFAAGDCAVTLHRQLGKTWQPLGTTAHKQGRVAGENAIGGHRRFQGSLGTQVVKVFDLVAARTGLRADEAHAAGYGDDVDTVTTTADDHKAYYPGATPTTVALTADRKTGTLLGAQLIGRRGSETAKRVDVYAVALFHRMTVDQISDLDLSYTPPLGSPWDVVQIAAQTWTRQHHADDLTPTNALEPAGESR